MELVNKILVAFLALAVIIPVAIIVVFVPIVILYNWKLKRLQDKIKIEVNERNVQTFTAWFLFGPLLKNDARWKKLIETFNIVNNNKEIRNETKEKLYYAYKNRNCNPGKLKLNKKE